MKMSSEDDELSEEEESLLSSDEDIFGARSFNRKQGPLSFRKAQPKDHDSGEDSDDKVGTASKKKKKPFSSISNSLKHEYDDTVDDDLQFDDFRANEGGNKAQQRTAYDLPFKSFKSGGFSYSNNEEVAKSAAAAETSKDEFGRDVPKIHKDSAKSSTLNAENHRMKELLKARLNQSQGAKPTASKVENNQQQKNVRASSPPVEEHKSSQGKADLEAFAASFQKSGISKMAIKYFLKNSATGRLGKNEQGIAAPIEVITRPERAGLGLVEEASSLPTNKANTEHLERLRLEAMEKEAREKEFIQSQQQYEKIWRKQPFEESYFSDSNLAKMVSEEELGTAEVVRAVEQMSFEYKEQVENLQRQIAVSQAMMQSRERENKSEQEEAKLIVERNRVLDNLILKLEPLGGEGWLRPSIVEKVLKTLLSQFNEDIWQDYELDRLGPAIIKSCIAKCWDDNQDLCLDIVEAVYNVYGSDAKTSILPILMKEVVPKLNKAADDYRLASDGATLHLTVFPWLVYLAPALEAVLVVPLKALERELSASWTNLEDIKGLIEFINPWKDICGGDEFVQELVARSIGSKLFLRKDVSLCSLYFNNGLLSVEDFACTIEGALQEFVRPGSPFLEALTRMEIAKAARIYAELKTLIPSEALKDSCCRGRIRHIFQYALELFSCAMSGKSLDEVNIGVANAIEPVPKTFAEAWYRNRVETAKPVEVAADYSAAATLQYTVESIAESKGQALVVHPQEKRVDGKKVYQLARIYCYFDRGVIFASKSLKDWKPVSIDQLFEL